MNWNGLLISTLCGPLVLAGPTVAAQSMPDTVSELLSYECAKSVTSLTEDEHQGGPLFFQDGLLFTSIEAKDNSKILLVHAGFGIFSIRLEGEGVKRLRFELPAQLKDKPKVFFLSYLHGSTFRSRYFDFGAGRPPLGRDELDYVLVNPQRAAHLLSHLDYAIHQTVDSTLTALTDGRLARAQIHQRRVENCEHIARRSPTLARILKRNLDVLDMMVGGPLPLNRAGRQPASMPSP